MHVCIRVCVGGEVKRGVRCQVTNQKLTYDHMACMCVYAHAFMCGYVCVCVCVYIYIYTYITYCVCVCVINETGVTQNV
jgi:hypothetical protein